MLIAAAKVDSGLRRALTLAVATGPDAQGEEIARQIQRLRTERGRVNAAKAVRIGREATRLIEAIVTTLGRDAPGLAVERLLDFIDAARAVLDRRTGEGRPLPELFASLGAHAATLMSRLDGPAQTLRLEHLLQVVMADAGEVAPELVLQIAAVLTADARAELRGRIERELAAPGEDFAALVSALSQLADAQGDVDAWIGAQARLPLQRRDVAGVARRLLAAGRHAEAMAALDATPRGGLPAMAGCELRVAALEAGGRREEAQAVRWRAFETSLSAQALRAFLKRLPDFEDVERESDALDRVTRHPDVAVALRFLVDWPDLRRAGALVRERIEAWDGDVYAGLTSAAEALAHRDPMAATLLFRRMIDVALESGRAARYAETARQLDACAALAPRIVDWEARVEHVAYVDGLFARHFEQARFWRRVHG